MSEVNPPCARCGGPHPFDTTVPSPVWNSVIRSRGLQEYLCLTCIVEAFMCFGESFTATLWGGPFQGGLPIEVRWHSQAATDAAKVSEENTKLRFQLRERNQRGSEIDDAIVEWVVNVLEIWRDNDGRVERDNRLVTRICERLAENAARWARRASDGDGYSENLVEAMNDGRWRDATMLLLAKVDSLYVRPPSIPALDPSAQPSGTPGPRA